jgi:hypothetical protein
MALTTFSGPVRSLNGFIGATQNSTTGEYTNNFVINTDGTVVHFTSSCITQVLLQQHLSATTGDSNSTFAATCKLQLLEE